MTMIGLNWPAIEMAKRISAATNRRASEIYPYAAALLNNGTEAEQAEAILLELASIAIDMPMAEILELGMDKEETE